MQPAAHEGRELTERERGEDVEMQGGDGSQDQRGEENADDVQNQQKRFRRDSSGVGSSEAPPGLGNPNLAPEIQQRHAELKRDLGRMDRELRDVKTTAAKALATSTEAKQEISTLKERIDKIEKEGYAGSSAASSFSAGGSSFRTASDRPRNELPEGNIPRQDLLGGQTGGELIVGGFPAWT